MTACKEVCTAAPTSSAPLDEFGYSKFDNISDSDEDSGGFSSLVDDETQKEMCNCCGHTHTKAESEAEARRRLGAGGVDALAAAQTGKKQWAEGCTQPADAGAEAGDVEDESPLLVDESSASDGGLSYTTRGRPPPGAAHRAPPPQPKSVAGASIRRPPPPAKPPAEPAKKAAEDEDEYDDAPVLQDSQEAMNDENDVMPPLLDREIDDIIYLKDKVGGGMCAWAALSPNLVASRSACLTLCAASSGRRGCFSGRARARARIQGAVDHIARGEWRRASWIAERRRGGLQVAAAAGVGAPGSG